MKGRESRSDMWHTEMGNSDRLMPVGGTISNYKVTQEDGARPVQENIQRDKEIDDNLE